MIAPGKRVTLHFSLRLTNGETIDSTFDKSPATFEVGDGSLPGSIEAKLFGLTKGDSTEFVLEPSIAFGQVNPGSVQRVARQKFTPDIAMEEGLVVTFDAGNGEMLGIVRAVEGDEVVIDFNHPLAGKTLLFEVDILAIEDA